MRSWACGPSIGGSERQSWEVLSQPLHLGCGWTGGGADSEKLWFEEDLCNQLPGKTEGSRFGQDPVDKEAHCFARRVCLGLAQTQLHLHGLPGGCPEPGPPGMPGENLLGPPQEQC